MVFTAVKYCSILHRRVFVMCLFSDILVLGIGDPGTKLSPDVFKYLRSKRLNVEILPTVS